jgi:hypothetical protein
VNDGALDLRAYTAINDRLFTELGAKLDQGMSALGEQVRDLAHSTKDVSERLARFEGKLDGAAVEVADVKEGLKELRGDHKVTAAHGVKLENRVVRLETMIVPAAALLSAVVSAFLGRYFK